MRLFLIYFVSIRFADCSKFDHCTWNGALYQWDKCYLKTRIIFVGESEVENRDRKQPKDEMIQVLLIKRLHIFLLFFPHLIFHTQSVYRENTSCINKEWEKAGETLARQMNAMEVFDQFKRKRNETHKAKKQHEQLLFGRISDPDSSVATTFLRFYKLF